MGQADFSTHRMTAEKKLHSFGNRVEANLVSSNGRLIVAGASGHFVPMTEPNLVVDAIREIVEDYRAR